MLFYQALSSLLMLVRPFGFFDAISCPNSAQFPKRGRSEVQLYELALEHVISWTKSNYHGFSSEFLSPTIKISIYISVRTFPWVDLFYFI